MKKHSVQIVVQHETGYLTEKTVGAKGRKLSRKVAEKIAARLRKSGFIANVAA